MKIILIVLFTQFSSGFFSIFQNNPQESGQNVKNQEDIKVDPLLLGLYSNYRDICKKHNQVSNLTLAENLETICNVVIKSELCQEVAEEYLLDCRTITHRPQLNFWDYYKGCGKGGIDSIAGLIEFTWLFINAVKEDNGVSRLLKNNHNAGKEYSNGIRLYLHNEYEKAYANMSDPNRSIKAIKTVTKSFSKKLMNALLKWIDEKVDVLGCLNFESRTRMACSLMTDFILPSKGASMVAKHGSKRAAKIFNRTEKSLDASDKGTKVLTQMESFLETISRAIKKPLR